MKKIGVFVGENGQWNFFHDIFADLKRHYTTQVFTPKTYRTPFLSGRLNRWAFQTGIESLLRACDVGFFEWASELLVPATQTSKYCPIVTRLHSYEINVWAPKVNWENVDKVIVLSENMQRRFAERFPQHANKTEIVFNGIRLDRFKPAEEFSHGFNIGILANVHPVKRIYDLILQVYELVRQGYSPHLHVAGDKWPGGYFDDYFIAVHRAVEKLNLADHVTFYGRVEDTASWLRGIDIFVSNSYWEGQQVALLEALASGCYCLCHFWDGAEEILPVDNIFVTGNELQQKLIEYYELPDDVKFQKRFEARTIAVTKFDSKHQHAEFRRIIEATLQTAGR